MAAGYADEVSAGAGGHGRLRASHADREQVISVLKAAFVQGMVDKDEFDLRVGQAYASRTCAELAAVTADILAGLATAKPPTPARAQGEQPVLRPLLVMVAATLMYAGLPVYAALSPKGGDTHVKGLLVFVGFCVYFLVLVLCVRQIATLERSGGKPPRRPAAGAGGRASQCLPSADLGGQLPPVDQGHQHTAEAARKRRSRLASPGSRSLRRWHLRKLGLDAESLPVGVGERAGLDPSSLAGHGGHGGPVRLPPAVCPTANTSDCHLVTETATPAAKPEQASQAASKPP